MTMRGASQAASKQAIRSAVLAQRRQLGSSDARDWSRAIQDRALRLGQYQAAGSVALYSPINNEVATKEIFDAALRAGKSVYFPRIELDRTLSLIRVLSVVDFAPGPLGILEPRGEERLDPGQLLAMMVYVPGIAFDTRGNRVGYGKGYYDRLRKELSAGATFAALAYEFQVVEAVPCESWDQKVHLIVTERRIIDCATTAAQSVPSL